MSGFKWSTTKPSHHCGCILCWTHFWQVNAICQQSWWKLKMIHRPIYLFIPSLTLVLSPHVLCVRLSVVTWSNSNVFGLDFWAKSLLACIEQFWNDIISAHMETFALCFGRFSRKPLILASLAGYLLLNVIYMVNAFWFYQLKVFHKWRIPTDLLEMEFLLFECLQDLTGGDLVFLLGVNSLLVDSTTTDERTTRLVLKLYQSS